MTTPIYVKSAYSFLSSLITIDDLITYGLKNNLRSFYIFCVKIKWKKY